MRIADKLKKFVTGKTDEELEEEEKQKQDQSGEETVSESEDDSEESEKYSAETCALCGGTGADRKWAGQYWHKKCFRAARKGAKKMI